jgi:GH25 family lysozyme M1 (1,4-beta-N-acetylmuramidase)
MTYQQFILARGPDCYHGDGNIQWGEVLGAGYSFGIAKCSTGTDTPDPLFLQNWQRMGMVGMTRAAYHWLTPTGDGKAQAEYFLSLLNPGPECFVGLDCEDDQNGAVDSHTIRVTARDWLIEVKKAMGEDRVKFYSFPDFIERHDLGSSPDILSTGLWISHPGASSPRIAPWTAYDIWQRWTTDSNPLTIPGCPNPVDGNEARWRHAEMVAAFGLRAP